MFNFVMTTFQIEMTTWVYNLRITFSEGHIPNPRDWKGALALLDEVGHRHCHSDSHIYIYSYRHYSCFMTITIIHMVNDCYYTVVLGTIIRLLRVLHFCCFQYHY